MEADGGRRDDSAAFVVRVSAVAQVMIQLQSGSLPPKFQDKVLKAA